jgi:hypothetical protein
LNLRAGNRAAANLLKTALAGGAIASVLYDFYSALSNRPGLWQRGVFSGGRAAPGSAELNRTEMR